MRSPVGYADASLAAPSRPFRSPATAASRARPTVPRPSRCLSARPVLRAHSTRTATVWPRRPTRWSRPAGLSSNALAGIGSGGSSKRAASPAGDGGSGGVSGSQAGVPSPRQSGGIPSPGGSAAGRRSSAGTATAVRPQFVPKPSSSAAPVNTAQSSKMPVIAAAAAVGVLVCAGGIWWVVFSGKEAPEPAPQVVQTVPALEPKVWPAPPVDVAPKPVATSEPAPASAPVAVPVPAPVPATVPAPAAPVVASSGSICGISLEGESVIYIVDRAGCTVEGFGQILDACYASILSLGEQRKFGLAVWNDAQELAYPTGDLAMASAASVEECRTLMAKANAWATNISGLWRRRWRLSLRRSCWFRRWNWTICRRWRSGRSWARRRAW